jgi:hypothetical protein
MGSSLKKRKLKKLAVDAAEIGHRRNEKIAHGVRFPRETTDAGTVKSIVAAAGAVLTGGLGSIPLFSSLEHAQNKPNEQYESVADRIIKKNG